MRSQSICVHINHTMTYFSDFLASILINPFSEADEAGLQSRVECRRNCTFYVRIYIYIYILEKDKFISKVVNAALP